MVDAVTGIGRKAHGKALAYVSSVNLQGTPFYSAKSEQGAWT